MITTQILGIENKEWDDFISKSHVYDFHHTRSYHILETKNSKNTSVLFVVGDDINFIAIPLIFRPIEGTEYCDCTSVYGYCGPISSLDFKRVSKKLNTSFSIELKAFLIMRKCVSAFSRLHPLLDSAVALTSLGSIREVNKTIAMDIGVPLDEQRKQYRKSNKSEINQLKKKKGYVVHKAVTDDEIKEFVSVYTENMKRVNATPYYFFDFDYFKNILTSPDYNAELLVAYQGEVMTAGAIFTTSNKIMQYHLAGTREAFVRDTPMKLILDEARLLANELSLDYLHMGGGVGGSDEDSLFRFKSGFSKMFFQFSTWQYIVNETVYNELAQENGVDKSDFFPLYRAPKQT